MEREWSSKQPIKIGLRMEGIEFKMWSVTEYPKYNHFMWSSDHVAAPLNVSRSILGSRSTRQGRVIYHSRFVSSRTVSSLVWLALCACSTSSTRSENDWPHRLHRLDPHLDSECGGLFGQIGADPDGCLNAEGREIKTFTK